MKHNYLKHLFTALLLLFVTVANAYDFEVSGIYYNILSEEAKSVEVTKGAYSGSVVIPENVTYNDVTYSVTSIANDAFFNCSGLTSVEIPDNVKTIGYSAFAYCNSLSFVVFGSGVVNVCMNAFIGTYVEEVFIDDLSAWCRINFDGAQANPIFHSEKLYLNGEVIHDLVIPDDVKTIGSYAFYYCSSLTSIKIPDNVISIGKGAFGMCNNVKQISLGNCVADIGGYAFYSCRNITEVVIPEGVESIGECAFSGLTNLTSITIPSTLSVVGKDAFRSLDNLAQINICDIGKWCNIVFANEYANPMSNLGYGDEIYLNNVSITKLELPDNIVSIGDYAFYGANYVFRSMSGECLVIPEGVTNIGDYAFYSFPMDDVSLPTTLKTIGNYVFHNCTYLNKVIIPNGVKSIPDHAFSGCSTLQSVEIPSSITSIGDYAFMYCNNLTSITSYITVDDLFTISNYAFEDFDKSKCILYVPCGAKEIYAATSGWSGFENIVEIATFDLEVTVAGYATLYLDFAVEIPEEVDVYTANAVEGDLLKMEQITDFLPANTGVIVKANEGTYTFSSTGENIAEIEGNLLKGSAESITITAENNTKYYVLSMVDGEVGMYLAELSDGAFLNNANKAYLPLYRNTLGVYDGNIDTSNGGQLSNGFRFDFGGTTGIENVKGENGNVKTMYDLQGRKVEKPTEGIYIINGKKILVK